MKALNALLSKMNFHFLREKKRVRLSQRKEIKSSSYRRWLAGTRGESLPASTGAGEVGEELGAGAYPRGPPASRAGPSSPPADAAPDLVLGQAGPTWI